MDLSEIKKSLSESTKGNWVQHGDTVKIEKWMCISACSVNADAHLIANSPKWISSLITEVERLSEECDMQNEIIHILELTLNSISLNTKDSSSFIAAQSALNKVERRMKNDQN